MTDLPIPLDVRSGGVHRDYNAIFEDLRRVAAVLLPEWTYMGADDFGVALLGLLAYTADHLKYDADRVEREISLASTVFYKIARQWADLVGFKPLRHTAAQAEIQITIPVQTEDLTIEIGTRIGSQGLANQVFYETREVDIILAGETESSLILAEEGTTVGPVSLGAATGDPFETFVLEDASAIFNYGAADVEIRVDDELASLVLFSIDALPTDLAYWVRITEDDFLEVHFGDGTYGRKLAAGAAVTITYRQGGGPGGRAPAGSLTELLTTLTLPSGATIAGATVTNANGSIGGSFRMSLDEIRRQAPAFFRTQNRAVTKSDYESLALAVPGVFAAKAAHVGVNGVLLYIVPVGADAGSELTAALRRAIAAYLADKKATGDYLSVESADLVYVDVTLSVVAFPNHRNAEVRKRVLDEFDRLDPNDLGILAFEAQSLGDLLARSDMVNRIDDLEGVNYLNVQKFTARPYLRYLNATGNAAFSEDGVTLTNDTQAQTWRISFTDATSFVVIGSVSGQQLATGTLGTEYTVDNGEISFTLEAGTVAMVEADYIEFPVWELAGNIQLAPLQFPIRGVLSVTVTGGIG